MSTKELNKVLVSIKNATNSENHKEALSICNDALKTFSENYQIYCFAGKSAKALDNMKLALEYLQHATTLQPEQELAWQGLEEIYAAQHIEYVGTSAEIATDDKWIDVLLKWLGCGKKKRKIQVKLGKALMVCNSPARRREAFDLWASLIPTSKNDNMLKIPLMTAFNMIIGSPLVNNIEEDLEILTYGTPKVRMEIIEQYLEYTARQPDSGATTSLEKVLSRYIGEALSSTTIEAMSTTVQQCDHMIIKYDHELKKKIDTIEVDGGDMKEKEAIPLPIFLEIRLLNHLIPMATTLSCCRTCSRNDDDNNDQKKIAKCLVRRYPSRPLGHLYIALCRSSDTNSGNDQENEIVVKLKHATDALSIWMNEKKKERKNMELYQASLKSSISLSSTNKKKNLIIKMKELLNKDEHIASVHLRDMCIILCHLIYSDLTLSTIDASIVRNDSNTVSELDNQASSVSILNTVISQCTRGINMIQEIEALSSSMHVQVLTNALRLCIGIAKIRNGSSLMNIKSCFTSIVDDDVNGKSIVTENKMEENEKDRTLLNTNKQIQRYATLGLIECAAYGTLKSDYDHGRQLCKEIDIKNFIVVGLGGMIDSKECIGLISNVSRSSSDDDVVFAAKEIKELKRAIVLLSKALDMIDNEKIQKTLCTTHWEAIFHIELGNAMWKLKSKDGTTTDVDDDNDYRKNKKYCYNHWMKAIRLRPSWGVTLCYLGKYFIYNNTSTNDKQINKYVNRGLQLIESGLVKNPFMKNEGKLYACTLLSPSTVDNSPENINRVIDTYDTVIYESKGLAKWALNGCGALHMGILSRMSTSTSTTSTSSDSSTSSVITKHLTKAIDSYHRLLRLYNPTATATDGSGGDDDTVNVDQCIAWLKLGQAYQMGCRWSPAIKSFEECVELCVRENVGEGRKEEKEEDTILAWYRVTALRCLSEVNVAISNYEEGIEHARNALSLLSKSTTTTTATTASSILNEKRLLSVSLAMGLLQLARRHVSSDLFGHAYIAAMDGLNVLCSSNNNTSTSEKKMIGDLHSLLGALPSTVHRNSESDNDEQRIVHLQHAYESYESVLASFVPSSSSALINCITKGRMLLDLSVSSYRLYKYKKILAKYNDNINIHLLRAKETLNTILKNNDGEVDSKVNDNNDTNEELVELIANAWNVLGVIEASECSLSPSNNKCSPVIAQYCFSRAIKLLNGNYAQAWSNIGFL
jgi:tetratricopeptide (TPR) repeat protein